MVLGLALLFPVLTIGSIQLLRIYAGPGVEWHVYAVVLISWVMSIGLLLLVSSDLAETYEERCQAESLNPDDCIESSIERRDVENFQYLTYWLSVFFASFYIPIQQSYVESGHFTFGTKFKAAIRENIYIYGGAGIVSVLLVAYIASVADLGIEELMGIASAMSAAVGLAAIVVLMSYGLIQLPRTLWQHGHGPERSLRYCQFRAPLVHKKMVETEARLHETMGMLDDKTRCVAEGDPEYPYVAEIVKVLERKKATSLLANFGRLDAEAEIVEIQPLDGWLYKRGARGTGVKTWKKRWFTLRYERQGLAFRYYKEPPSVSGASAQTGQGFIPVDKIEAVELEQDRASKEKSDAEVRFRIVTGGREYKLKAENLRQAEKWVTELRKLVETYLRIKEKGGDTGSVRIRMANTKQRRRQSALLDIDGSELGRLASLHSRVKKDVSEAMRARSIWVSLYHRAIVLEDVIESRKQGHRVGERWWLSRFFGPLASVVDPIWYKWNLTWKWRFMRCAAILCGILSLCTFASEMLTPFGDDLSLYALVAKDSEDDVTSLELVVLIPLIYNAFCCYYSLFRMQFFNLYRLVPGHSDSVSLLFNALFVCRITGPLCYNFYVLIDETDEVDEPRVSFFTVVGNMSEVPIIGSKFQLYFPITLGVLVVLNYFDVVGKVLRLFGRQQFSFRETDFESEHCATGAALISKERHLAKEKAEKEKREFARKSGVLTEEVDVDAMERGSLSGAAGENSATSLTDFDTFSDSDYEDDDALAARIANLDNPIDDDDSCAQGGASGGASASGGQEKEKVKERGFARRLFGSAAKKDLAEPLNPGGVSSDDAVELAAASPVATSPTMSQRSPKTSRPSTSSPGGSAAGPLSPHELARARVEERQAKREAEYDNKRRSARNLAGYLMKTGAKGMAAKSWKRRWFEVNWAGWESELWYYKDKTKESLQGSIVLREVNEVVHPSPTHGPCGFDVRAGKRTFQIKASSPSEAEEWVRNLRLLVDDCVASTPSLK
eukprot:Rmarinus@m.26199